MVKYLNLATVSNLCNTGCTTKHDLKVVFDLLNNLRESGPAILRHSEM